MDFGRISRRHLLQGSAALTLGTALGARSAAAADTTIGFIYVGSRDDYGYNQAHAQGAGWGPARCRPRPGVSHPIDHAAYLKEVSQRCYICSRHSRELEGKRL